MFDGDGETTAQRKARLRKEALQRRRAIPDGVALKNSEAIAQKLEGLDRYDAAGTIMFYVSAKKNEVNTHGLIKRAIRSGKRVVVPITDLNNRSLHLSHLKDFGELTRGTFGLLEPGQEFRRNVDPQDIEIVIVPGVAFDRQGNRIGFGGGFYDGLLRDLHIPKIALAHECQMYEQLPTDEGDVMMDMIITEKGVYGPCSTGCDAC